MAKIGSKDWGQTVMNNILQVLFPILGPRLSIIISDHWYFLSVSSVPKLEQQQKSQLSNNIGTQTYKNYKQQMEKIFTTNLIIGAFGSAVFNGLRKSTTKGAEIAITAVSIIVMGCYSIIKPTQNLKILKQNYIRRSDQSYLKVLWKRNQLFRLTIQDQLKDAFTQDSQLTKWSEIIDHMQSEYKII